MNRFWLRLAHLVDRRRGAVALVAVLITALAVLGLPRLAFKTSQDAFVDPGSEVYADNLRYQQAFGGEPMLVLLSGDVRAIVAPDNLAAIHGLEEELRATGAFHAVVGPYVALQLAADELAIAPELLTAAASRDVAAAAAAARVEVAADGQDIAAQEKAAADAGAVTQDRWNALLAEEMTRIAAAGEQSLANPRFAEFLVFDASGEVRPALRDAFPDAEHALMIVRLPGNASIDEQSAGAVLVRDIVAGTELRGVHALATGPPVLLKEINDYLQGGMATLGLVAVAVMLLLLAILFRVRWRLLPLAVVAVGGVWAFGLVGWMGTPLTMVTISGLPIFIGLGVDFAVQMHNRYVEQRARGTSEAAALEATFVRMGGPLLVSMVAAAVGFTALRFSRVPMIRDFGVMLSAGIVALVAAAILLPLLALSKRPSTDTAPRAGAVEHTVRWLGSLPRRAVLPVVVLGLVLGGAGLAVEGGLPVQTDPERWVDPDGRAVHELEDLRDGTGFSSELGLLIDAADVTDPAVISWMHRFAAAQLDQHEGVLLRATSAPGVAGALHGIEPVKSDVDAVLALLPIDIEASLISDDRTKANLVFPIAPVSLSEREALLDDIRADLDGDLAPPPGVEATPAGLAVVGIELVAGMEANRRTLSLIALALVALWLVIRYRSMTDAVVPLVPVVMAVGLASLVVDQLGIELTPLTTVAGPLVIAVATEFAVLIQSRFKEELAGGRTPSDAVRDGLPKIGRAFVASGLTLVGGFAVLAYSAMPVLRDFGIVVALAVLIALLCCLVVLPPLLLFATDRRAPRRRRAHPPAPTHDDRRHEPVLTGTRRSG